VKTVDKIVLSLLAVVTVILCLGVWQAGQRRMPVDVLSELTAHQVKSISASRYPKSGAPVQYDPTEAEIEWLTAQLAAMEDRAFSICREPDDYRKGMLYLRFSIEDRLAELLLKPMEQEAGWFSLTFDEVTDGLFDQRYRVFWPELAQWLEDVLA
jgi:hypothetical protein